MKKISANLSKETLINSNEAHLYHIELLNRENDPILKKYVDRKVIQIFTPAEYELMKSIKFFGSYDKVTILHNPTNVAGPAMEDPEELKDLVARFTELFGKAPANNALPANIKERVLLAELSSEYQIQFGEEVPAEFKTYAALKAAYDAKVAALDTNKE